MKLPATASQYSNPNVILEQPLLCPPRIGACNFSPSSAELRKAAHPLIASLSAVDKFDPCCFFSGDITVSCLWISANKSCSRHRCSRGRWPRAVVQGNAAAAGKRGDFRRSKEKCVCPPFLFDIISLPNALMPKDDGYFKQHRSHKAKREQAVCCTAVFKPTHCTQSLVQPYFLTRVISVRIE